MSVDGTSVSCWQNNWVKVLDNVYIKKYTFCQGYPLIAYVILYGRALIFDLASLIHYDFEHGRSEETIIIVAL